MIEFVRLNKSFLSGTDRVAAVDDVSFTVKEGQFYVLLGASGSGKTTTLRCLAGLEEPESGEIRIDGETVFSSQQSIRVPVDFRPIGMVFQSYALWPHMTVFNNVAFPLRYGRRGLPTTQIADRVRSVLRTLQLEEQIYRPVTTLSGGQQQRVALARALALGPKVLLMDEPLSNLDAKLRGELRVELKQLTRNLNITTIYVTHDQAEALVLGDVVGVMNRGRMVQESEGWDVYQNPRDLYVAEFMGESNFITGTVCHSDNAKVSLETSIGRFLTRCPQPLTPGTKAVMGIKVESVRLEAAQDDRSVGDNEIRGTIRYRVFQGDSFLYYVNVGEAVLRVKTPSHIQFEPGQAVHTLLPADSCSAFSKSERETTEVTDNRTGYRTA